VVIVLVIVKYSSTCSGSMHQTDRVTTSALMNDIQRSIENWEEKDINKQCYDFLLGKCQP